QGLGRLAVDGEGVLRRRHLRRLAVEHEAAVHRVVLQQVRQVVGRDEVVDGDDLEGRVLGGDAVDQAADAAEAVDGDADGHGDGLLRIVVGGTRGEGTGTESYRGSGRGRARS